MPLWDEKGTWLIKLNRMSNHRDTDDGEITPEKNGLFVYHIISLFSADRYLEFLPYSLPNPSIDLSLKSTLTIKT